MKYKILVLSLFMITLTSSGSEPLNNKEEQNNPLPIGGLHDYVASLRRRELMQLAFALEWYHNKVHGIPEHHIGGLHDYIYMWSDHEIREMVINELDEHNELDTVEKVKKVITQYEKHHHKTHEVSQEIKNYLETLERYQLIRLGFAMELYHKYLYHSKESIGGLHDYIHKLSNEEIKKVVCTFIYEVPELNKLWVVKVIEFYEDPHYKLDEGIDEIVFSLKRPEMISLLYEIEQLKSKPEKDSVLLPLLWKLETEELAKKILDEIKHNPSLNSTKKIVELTKKQERAS